MTDQSDKVQEAWLAYKWARNQMSVAMHSGSGKAQRRTETALNKAVRAYAEAVKDAVLSDTLGLLEEIAKNPGEIAVFVKPGFRLDVVRRVEGGVGYMVSTDTTQSSCSRADAERLLEGGAE